MDDVCHPPVIRLVIADDHGHSCFDVQKDRIGLGHRDAARMINRHTPHANTFVLAEEQACGPARKPEEFRQRFRQRWI